MMDSLLKMAARKVGLVLVSMCLTVATIAMVSSPVQALTISVGTQTVVGTGNVGEWTVASDARGLSGQVMHVVYSTADATSYWVSYASMSVNGTYVVTQISSGPIANKPVYMKMSIGENTAPNIFYYDASSKTINYIIKDGAGWPAPKFVFGTGLVECTGLELEQAGNVQTGCMLYYSSKTAEGQYSLMGTTVTLGATHAAGITVGATTIISSATSVEGSGNVYSGKFMPVRSSVDGNPGVVYFDDANKALKAAYISGAAVVSRETIDTAASISDIYGTDLGKVFRLVYTADGIVKYAVKRWLISPQCWYIQKIDDGAAQMVGTFSDNAQVSYLKSGNLNVAIGVNGAFFDDFDENITNAQRGLASVVPGVKKSFVGAVMNTTQGGQMPRGVYQPTADNSGIASINWEQLDGTVANSFGTGLSGVRVRANVARGVNGVANDGTASDAGGITSGGAYQIFVASGANITVSASSSPFVFIRKYNYFQGVTSLSTNTVGIADGVGLTSIRKRNADFIAVSSSVIDYMTVSSASVLAPAVEDDATGAIIVKSSGSASIPANGFAAGMRARLVPDGVTIQTSTSPVEAGSILLAQVAGQPTAATQFTVWGSTSLWARYASTDTANLPKSYTLVVSTLTPAGHIMMASKASAFTLLPLQVAVVQGTPTLAMPGSNISVVMSSGQINTSRQTTFIIKSSSPYTSNIFNIQALQGNHIYLSSTTTIPPTATGTHFGGDISLGAVLSANNIKSDGVAEYFITTCSILGLTPSQYYIRIASFPANGAFNQPQIAFSPAITISSPAITAVRGENLAEGVAISTAGSTKLHVWGRGFLPLIGGSSWAVTTQPAIDATNSGLPVSTQTSVTAYTMVTSTFAEVTFDLRAAAISAGSGPLYVWFSTANVGVPGVVDEIGVGGTTVTALSPAISVASPTVFSISPTSVANSRVYRIEITGRGLRGGSSIQFVATDASTATNVVFAREDADFSSNTNLTKLTAEVDFRSGVFGGKSFNLVVSSAIFLDAGRPNTKINYGAVNGVLSVASMTVTSFGYSPSSAGVYNSTANANIVVNGIGLTTGAIVQVPQLAGNWEEEVITSINADGTSALFVATVTYNVAAGGYNFSLGRTFAGGAGGIGYSPFTSTTTRLIVPQTPLLQVLQATVTSVTALNDTNYNTMPNAQFKVLGMGLVAGTTAQLRYAADPSVQSSTMSAIAALTVETDTSAIVTFDLRSASQPATAHQIIFQRWYDAIGLRVSSESWQAVNTVNLIRNPVIHGITMAAGASTKNNAAVTVQIRGNGLTNGSTLFATALDGATTDYIAGVRADTTHFALTGGNAISGANSSGTLAQFVFPANKMPGRWSLTLSTTVGQGITTDGAIVFNGTGKNLYGAVTYAATGTVVYTVAESSAPNAPTGLTVLASGAKSVTLRWMSPGDDGSTGNLVNGSAWIVYYSSAEDIRGGGCAACYPANMIGSGAGEDSNLWSSATNFKLIDTWLNFVPFGDGKASTSTAFSPEFNFSTTSVRGISVATQTIDITAAIAPGTTIEHTLTIDPGTKDGNFFFVVRARDEVGNISRNDIVYTTASAKILALPVQKDVIDPNANTVLTVLTMGGGMSAGGEIPAGSLDGADTMNRVVDSNPPANTSGVQLVGSALNVTLESGKTEFKKAITLTFALSGAALDAIAGKDAALIKVAFHNGTRWVIIAESSLSGNTVSAKVSHLTSFAVVIAAPATNLSSAMVYPNPFRPSVAAQLAQGITFDGLPAGTKIKIYTLAGDLVREIFDTDMNGVEIWNATNMDGKDVASGVYFVLLDGGGEKKTMKLAVQR